MLRKLHETFKHQSHFIFFFIYVTVFLWAIVSSLLLLKSKATYKSKAEERDSDRLEQRDRYSTDIDNQRLKDLNYLQEKINHGDRLSNDEWTKYYEYRSSGRQNTQTQPDNFIYDSRTKTWRAPGPGDDSSFNIELQKDINLGTDRPGGSADPGGGGGGETISQSNGKPR